MGKLISISIVLILALGGVGYFIVDYLSNPHVVSSEVVDVISCTDSDGYNIYKKGVVEFEYFDAGETTKAGMEDVCNYYSKKTKSHIGLVRESYCEGDYLKTDWSTCGQGSVCRDGACVSEDSNVSICTDTDGGKDITIRGSIYGYGGSGDDRCIFVSDDGLEGSTNKCSGNECYVGEYFCDGEVKNLENIPCPSGCLDGACKQ